MHDMRSVAAAVLVSLGLAVGAPEALADGADAGQRAAPQNPKCIVVTSSARYSGYGYDHIVEIDNSCDRAMSCTVNTDAAPEPTTVKVPAKEKKTVVTLRGSPAREFKADVRCKTDA
jgi:hypothetical protein